MEFIYVGLFSGLALVTFGIVLWMVTLRRVVPTNMVHIVQYRKSTVSYGKSSTNGNVYYAWPSWMPVIGVTLTTFPESVFDIFLESYDAYDIGRLPFIVDVKAFFRVSESATAAQRVSSFIELREQLKAILQGTVRKILGTNKLEVIMQDRATLADEFTKEVDAQLKEWGVCTVKSIEFMDIRDSRDSQVILNMMAKEKSRIEKESRITVAENQREAQLKEIDAQRTVEVQRQDAAQQVGLRTAEKDKAVGIADEQARQEIQAQARVTAERNMDVLKVEQVRTAEIHKDVAIVNAEQKQREREITAEADKNVQIITAEGEKTSTVTKAQGDLEAAKLNAQGIEAEGIAKGAAEQAILMAPVNTQITLAKEIGSNEGYQQYLVTIRQVEAGQAVGLEMAKAMQSADLKVIANSGDVQSGITGLGDLFTTKGGMGMTGMLAALAQTDEGKALVGKFTKPTE